MRKAFTTILVFALAANCAMAQIRFNSSTPLNKLNMAVMAIKNLYVEDVDQEKLAEDAIKGMLEKLDPHSTYSNAKEVKQMNESLEGSFEGIGVQFNDREKIWEI